MASAGDEVEFSVEPSGGDSGGKKRKGLSSFFKFKGFKVFGTPRRATGQAVAPHDADAGRSRPATFTMGSRKGSGKVGVAPAGDGERRPKSGSEPSVTDRQGRSRKESGESSDGEKEREHKRTQRAFFDEMERNMRRNFAKGMISVEVEQSPDDGARAHRKSGTGSVDSTPKQQLRAVSSVDDSFLDSLAKQRDAAAGSGAASAPRARPAEAPIILEHAPALAKAASLTSTNSTNTMHIDSTLADPDIHAMIREKQKLRVFLDVSANAEELAGYLPSLGEMTEFFKMVFKRGEMHVECIVTALIFVERLLRSKGGALRLGGDNWRPVVFSTMILASKVCDDESPLNADWCYVCSDFTLSRINELETAQQKESDIPNFKGSDLGRFPLVSADSWTSDHLSLETALLAAYGFNATVTASEYATYYFHLRSMAARLGLMNNASLRPLDIGVARRIAASSNEITNPHNPRKDKDRPGQRRSASFRGKGKAQRRPSASLEQVVSMRPQVHGSGEMIRPPRMNPLRRGSV
ncbi:hypothetical protein JL720_9233 [Aureococcus anophagefferens]|nr:hypothetical protein JL720_9233 [Aureococcus anophagefferens]